MIKYSSEMGGMILTDTATAEGSLLGMAPKQSPERMMAEQGHRAEHAIQTFSQGVSYLMEQGNTTDIVALTESLVRAMRDQAIASGRVEAKLKPHWLSIGTLVALVSLIIPALLYCGSLQNRVANLEDKTRSLDTISSLAAKVEALTGTVDRLDQRVYQLLDGRSSKSAR
jgi:hypothetical protein